MKITNNRFGLVYSVLLTLFTLYTILDTFVIPKTYATLPDTSDSGSDIIEETLSNENSSNITDTPIITDLSYSDARISINISFQREYDSDIYIADIKLASANLLKTALAKNAFGSNVKETTTEIAVRNNAILAINGDYYGARGYGNVMRNGFLFRSDNEKNQEDLVIYKDGSFGIITETQTTAEEAEKNGAQHIFSFGPSLIVDGKITAVCNKSQHYTKNPRTAIGIIDDLHYVFITVDGRTNQSKGLTVSELASFMLSLGATCAYNLDGGGSATFYFNGKVLNNPTQNGKDFYEREISDIVYIGY